MLKSGVIGTVNKDNTDIGSVIEELKNLKAELDFLNNTIKSFVQG